MSRELPPNPNLDHLKKQAKDRLADLRQHTPSARLADAQHAVALEYGLHSWAALKAHAASLAVNYHFDRYTPDAKRVLYFSREEAARRGSPTIEPSDVMLGLVREGHVTPERARTRMPLGLVSRDPLPGSAMIPFGVATLRLLKRVAVAGADRIGVRHLLEEVLR